MDLLIISYTVQHAMDLQGLVAALLDHVDAHILPGQTVRIVIESKKDVEPKKSPA